MKAGAGVLFVVLTVIGCTSSTPVAHIPSPAAVATPARSPSPPPDRAHVFLIVMENHSYAQALSQPFTASLADTYAVATNYRAVAHPSLPNYLALTSGTTWGITDDAYHALAGKGLGDQLTEAGISWRAYMEGMTRGCFQSPLPYVLSHNPFAYYGGGCPPNVVPMAALDGDLSSPDAPRLMWIQPDNCHSTHSCPIETGDQWLSEIVPRITASAAWKSDGLLLITWDEDDGSASNHVATLAIAPDLLRHQTSLPYNHYSLLATVEDQLGVPRLGNAGPATAMADLVAS